MKNIIIGLLVLFSSASFAQVVPRSVTNAWGYGVESNTKFMYEFCDGSIEAQSVEYQSIKSLVKSKELPEAYYRFTLGKEVYSSVTKANQRVIDIVQPTRKTSKHSKLCNIRSAVSVGSVVYFVHTDVGAFRQEVDVVLDKLVAHVSKP